MSSDGPLALMLTVYLESFGFTYLSNKLDTLAKDITIPVRIYEPLYLTVELAEVLVGLRGRGCTKGRPPIIYLTILRRVSKESTYKVR